MILRRVIAHFRRQEWTAIALDFVIVVVGVFIGIQVSNLNNERGDRAREAAYMAQLVDDLTADFDEMELVTAAARERMAVISMLFSRAGAPPPPETFYLGHCVYEPCTGTVELGRGGEFKSELPTAANDALTNQPQFNAVEHTYGALVSTGDIGLLRDIDIRRKIQAYYAKAAEVRNLDGAVGLQFQELNKSRHELGLAASGVDLDALVAAVGASDTLEAQLRSHWAYSGFQIRSMAHMRNLAEALIADIETVE